MNRLFQSTKQNKKKSLIRERFQLKLTTYGRLLHESMDSEDLYCVVLYCTHICNTFTVILELEIPSTLSLSLR